MSEWREGFRRIDAAPGLTHRGKFLAEQSYMRKKLDEYEQESGRLRRALAELVRIPNDDGFALMLWFEDYKDLVAWGEAGDGGMR